MKVILMQKVERLGEPGQQVEVADGYARNFLLPQQLAVLATPGRVRSIVQLTAQAKNREDRTKHEATVLAERLATLQITLRRLAGEEEIAAPAQPAATEPVAEASTLPEPAVRAARLFGSVSSQDIVEALAAQGISLDRKKILLPEPIKSLGVHRVPVRLHAEVSSELVVTVERER